MKVQLLVAVLALTTLSAWGLSFKATMQPLKLPVTLAMSLPPEQPESVPGQMTVGLQRMCGDGDVAHLQQTNPQIEFVPQSVSSMDVLVGYWMIEGNPDADSSYLPTSSSFRPVAYVKGAQIGNNPASIQIATDFLPISHSIENGKNGLEILASEIINIYRNGQRSFGPAKSYQVMAGVFTCMNVDDASAIVSKNDSQYKYVPSTTELTNQMSHDNALPKLAYDNIKNLSEADYKDGKFSKVLGYGINSPTGSMLRFPVDENRDYTPLKIFLDKDDAALRNQNGASSISSSDLALLSGNQAWSKFQNIMDLEWPVPELPRNTQAEVDAYNALSDTAKMAFLNGKIDNWKSALNIQISTTTSQQLAYCNSIGLQSSSTNSIYKWEVFPMNSSCRKLFNEGISSSPDSLSLSEAYNNLVNSVLSMVQMTQLKDNFYKTKRSLAARFYVANVLEVLQRKSQTNSALSISHANCFNTNGKPLITRLIGSYPLRFEIDAGGEFYTLKPNPFNHIHPEPLFALADWFDYKDSDVLGLWGQVVNRQPVYPPGAFSELTSYEGMDLSGEMYPPFDLSTFVMPKPLPAEPLHPDEWGIKLPVNDKPALNNNKVDGRTFKGPAINILFKIRSIGGNCPGFC